MAPSGRKPKPTGQAVTRHRPVHGWIEVDPEPFDGPKLPARRRDGTPWPDWAVDTWEAWRTMPHARLWKAADWFFATDTIELAAAAFQDGVKVGLAVELRLREKTMGTTWSARQDLRIKYIEPSAPTPEGVTVLEEYRNL